MFTSFTWNSFDNLNIIVLCFIRSLEDLNSAFFDVPELISVLIQEFYLRPVE